MSSFTQKHIEQTFIDMLNEQPFSQITVKALTERCGISRNCFYYHFPGIPKLMDTIAHRWIDDILHSTPSDATIEESCTIFMEAALREKKMLLHLYCSMDRQLFDDYMLSLSSYITDKYVSSRKSRFTISGRDQTLISSFFKHAFFGQFLNWMSHHMSYDLAHEMCDICALIDRTLTSIPTDA